jgi:transcription-repair coupling factor (superfamily II helicase)
MMLARQVGATAIDRRREGVSIKFAESAAVDPEKLARFVAQNRGAQFSPSGMLKFQISSTSAEEVLTRLRGLLEELSTPKVPAD